MATQAQWKKEANGTWSHDDLRGTGLNIKVTLGEHVKIEVTQWVQVSHGEEWEWSTEPVELSALGGALKLVSELQAELHAAGCAARAAEHAETQAQADAFWASMREG